MMDTIALLNNDNEKLWEDYINQKEGANFFHTLEWKRIIEKVYGYKSQYILAKRDDKVVGVCPMFYVTSLVFGKKFVTTPFNFYNGPLYDDEETLKMLTNHFKAFNSGVKYIEYKCINKLPNNELKLNDHYNISILKLPSTEEELLNGFQHGLKRNIKRRMNKSEEFGITINDIDYDEDELKKIYTVMVRTLRDRHHMIPQRYDLFKEIFLLMQQEGMAKILVAKKGNEICAAVFLLFFKDIVTDAWSVTNQKYLEYSPNTLLDYKALQYCVEMKYKYFDMGVTSPEQPSLLEFKESWGCVSKKLPYYYHLIKDTDVPHLDYHTSFAGPRKLFRFVPIWAIKIMTPFITRQLG